MIGQSRSGETNWADGNTDENGSRFDNFRLVGWESSAVLRGSPVVAVNLSQCRQTAEDMQMVGRN